MRVNNVRPYNTVTRLAASWGGQSPGRRFPYHTLKKEGAAMQNTELRRRARPVLDALRTLALQGRTPVLGLRKKSCPYHLSLIHI